MCFGVPKKVQLIILARTRFHDSSMPFFQVGQIYASTLDREARQSYWSRSSEIHAVTSKADFSKAGLETTMKRGVYNQGE